MVVTNEQTARLLSEDLKFSQLGFSMMITRMKTNYAKNPTSDTLQAYTTEINSFLDKFKPIMGEDYVQIQKL